MDKHQTEDGSNLNKDLTAYNNCAICTRPDHDESNMVFCEGCKDKDPENDAISVDDTTDGAAKDNAGKTRTISDGEKVAVAIEKMKKDKERLKRRMEQRLTLAKAQMELENEKMEMEWALEKQIMEMKIASKQAFQKKKDLEKKRLKDQLKKLDDGETQTEKEIQELERRKEEAKGKGTKAMKIEYTSKRPVSSTPIANPEASTSATGAKKKTVERKQLTTTMVKKNSCASVTRGRRGETESDEESSQEEESSGSRESEEEHHEEEEDEEEATVRKMKRNRPQEEAAPTKPQISARQFLFRKLPNFTGRPDEWPIFLSSFNTTTKVCRFSNLENLARLQESLLGPYKRSSV
ncbi:cyclin-dependent kinase 11B-like [Armigeres subalbatus]|uniref:cyclin-dependent kinase 11B-like n=1 Tax=Armigeres subalbatus TaxID=124917 RepID=UPI002ED505E3